jgi:hypothetical protein
MMYGSVIVFFNKLVDPAAGVSIQQLLFYQGKFGFAKVPARSPKNRQAGLLICYYLSTIIQTVCVHDTLPLQENRTNNKCLSENHIIEPKNGSGLLF